MAKNRDKMRRRGSRIFLIPLIPCVGFLCRSGAGFAQGIEERAAMPPPQKIEASLDGKPVQSVKIDDPISGRISVTSSHKVTSVKESSKLLTSSQQIPVSVELSSETGKKTATVDSVLPQSVAKFNQLKDDLKGKPGADLIANSFKKIATLARPHIESGSSASADKELQGAYDDLQKTLVTVYGEGALRTNDGDYRTNIAKLNRSALSDEKAIYGTNDNYVPEVYDAIYRRSRACVAIVHPDLQEGKLRQSWTPNASGVLIAPNLVLTCAHDVTDPVLSGNLEVWFGYEKDIHGLARAKTVTRVSRIVYNGRTTNMDRSPTVDPLDFSLLEIDPPITDKQSATLFSGPVPIDTPLYVIGYPRGDFEIVHDNTQVLFPYEVNEKTYAKLKLKIQTCAIGQEGGNSPKSRNSTKETDDLFNRSYQPIPLPAGKIYRYYWVRNQQHLPAIGANCDTFHGDSGGPAFLRNASECCGILVQGEPDPDVFSLATFLHHERILPMRAINERLSDPIHGLSGWPTQFQVVVVSL